MSNPEVIPGSFALVSYKKISKTDKQSFFETIGAHLITHFNVEQDLKIDIIKISPYHSSWIHYNFNVLKDVDAIAEIITMMSGYQMDCIPNFTIEVTGFPFEPKTPDDEYYPKQWGLTNTKTDQVWGDPYVALGQGVKVGIIDLGVDYNQPDLQGNLLPGYDCVNRVTGSSFPIQEDLDNPDYEFIYNPNYMPDPRIKYPVKEAQEFANHGTPVAGIIGATTNNKIGTAGIAPLVKMIPFQVGTIQSGESLAILAALSIIITKSKETGINMVDIINYSLGSYVIPTFKSQTIFQGVSAKLINKLVNELGILFVAGAGNDNTDSILLPAGLDMVIGVGGINEKNQKWINSNYGKNWVNIAAPGDNIYTTFNTTRSVNTMKYGPKSGTSFATPMVSGIAALVLGRLRMRLNDQKVILDNPQIVKLVTQILYESATQTPELEPYFQYGKVNALEAIKRVDTLSF